MQNSPTIARKNIKSASHLANATSWVFDLDNTLYSGRHGLFEQIDQRMKAYVGKFLGLSPGEAFKVQKQYFRQYGTTLRGLMTCHDMAPEPFLDFVHDIDVTVLPPAPELDQALALLSAPKVIFTNATRAHADRVLAQLGIGHHFEGVFDIVDTGFTPKPEPRVYPMIAEHFAIDPARAVMVEDIARNLEPAKELGMATVWVRTASDCEVCQEPPEGSFIDFETDDLASWLQDL